MNETKTAVETPITEIAMAMVNAQEWTVNLGPDKPQIIHLFKNSGSVAFGPTNEGRFLNPEYLSDRRKPVYLTEIEVGELIISREETIDEINERKLREVLRRLSASNRRTSISIASGRFN